MKTEIPLDTMLKRLHLANALCVARPLRPRREGGVGLRAPPRRALRGRSCPASADAAAEGLAGRRLPFLKTVDHFNFTYQSTVRLPLIGSYLSADFVTEGRSLILTGKPGRGKTHLAAAIAYRAIQNPSTRSSSPPRRSSRSSRWLAGMAVSAKPSPSTLTCTCSSSMRSATSRTATTPRTCSSTSSTERHLKRRSMIFTTNKSLDAWGEVLHDDDLAAAIVDRIPERGRLLELDGPSILTKHLGLDDPAAADASTQPARISGIRRQEFSGTHNPVPSSRPRPPSDGGTPPGFS